MKRVLFYLVAAGALLFCASCAQKNTISGQLEGLGDSLKVDVYDLVKSREKVTTMTIPVVDGKIVCDYKDSVMRGLVLSNPSNPAERASIIYVPGENAVIGGRLDSLVVLGGSAVYKDQKEYNDLCAEDRAKIKEIANEYRAIPDDAEDADAQREAVNAKYDEVSKHVASLTKDFIKGKPSSLYAATLLNQLVGEDGKDALEMLDVIPEKVKHGLLKDYIAQATERANKAKARSEAAEFVKDGMQAPDFTLKNEKGEDFTLSSIYNNGKYIILDFWGEWCYWCKKGIPDMKQLYKDAKGKIEILSIDCGDTEEVWKNAIVEHELPWLHVYNPGEGLADLAITYAIQGYPTKLILNPDGTINKTIIGEDPEFYDYVKSLIKK